MKSTAVHLPNGPAPHQVDSRAGKYLCFRVGKEDFAVHVARVREIMPMQPLTLMPQTPMHVKGAMNLRGKLIPVIDLRVKLGAPESEASPRTSIVVVQVETVGERVLIGMIVDSVSEVLTFKAGEIDDIAGQVGRTGSPYLIGVAKVKGRAKFLLDSNLVLSAVEIQSLEAVLV